jgi:superfamily II DNA or RNA helicase
MHKTTGCEYKYGLTGTLNDTQSHRLVLEGLFGPVKQVTTTRQLIDKKQLSDIKVTGIVLTYPKEECILRKYQDEIKYITAHSKRNNLIRNLSLDQTGNTLVLFSLIKHGELLYKLIKEKSKDVHLVYGATDTQTRESIRRITEESEGRILVASFGVFSTGVNIRNLHNIIFASPYKSRIRNLQSIGRGLRLHDSKVSAKLYDIADDFGGRNHTIKHFAERISIYNQEEFDYEIHKVQM